MADKEQTGLTVYERFMVKAKKDPLVPVGALATIGFLLSGEFDQLFGHRFMRSVVGKSPPNTGRNGEPWSLIFVRRICFDFRSQARSKAPYRCPVSPRVLILHLVTLHVSHLSRLVSMATRGDVSWDIAESLFGTFAAVSRACIRRDFVDGSPLYRKLCAAAGQGSA